MNLTPLVELASIADYPAIQNMARFYVYDFTRTCGFISKEWECPENGLYECYDLKKFFLEDNSKAYLVKIDNELAGFAMLEESLEAWIMSEFFIIAKFQGKGIGKQVANFLWKKHPGNWKVSVIPENKPGFIFWEKVIADYTAGDYQQALEKVDYDKDQPYRLIFGFYV